MNNDISDMWWATSPNSVKKDKDYEAAHTLTRSTGYVLSECCQELERQLTLGAYLGWQDRQWWLFRKDGEGIESGKTIEELLFKLYI